MIAVYGKESAVCEGTPVQETKARATGAGFFSRCSTSVRASATQGPLGLDLCVGCVPHCASLLRSL